jgi:hypothetical protein
MRLIDDESQVQSKLGPAGSGEFARLETKLLVKRGAASGDCKSLARVLFPLVDDYPRRPSVCRLPH